jgi:hypothetical protein
VLPLTAVAPIDIELPVQIAVFEITAAAGKAFTVITTELDFTHPLAFVSTSPYVVVTDGETVGFEDVEVNPEGALVQE